MDDPADLRTPPAVRVFLLDDHEIVRRRIADLLEAEPGITVVGEAATVSQALGRIPATCPSSSAAPAWSMRSAGPLPASHPSIPRSPNGR